MSLINQVLNDLEKRKATDGEEQFLSGNILQSVPTRRSNFGPMVLVVIVALAAGAGVAVWVNDHKTSAPIAHEVVVASVNAMPNATNATPAPAQPVSASGNAASPTPSAPVTQTTSGAVSRPSEPLVASQHEPKVTTVPKDATRTETATSAPQVSPKEAEEQAVTKPVAIEKVARNPAKATKQPSRLPKLPADQASPSSIKVVSLQQRSDNLYRQAISLIQQSRAPEAEHALKQAVGINPANHNARQLLAGLLVDAGKNAEATTLLLNGLNFAPGHSGFSMALARLQVANGSTEEALSTLDQGLLTAGDDAEYHAFLAALLQKQGRHAEAVKHYITALRSNPSMPNWLIGVGISLQAENKMNDAAEAFQRAIDTGELSVESAQFADQQLKQIRQPR